MVDFGLYLKSSEELTNILKQINEKLRGVLVVILVCYVLDVAV